MASVNIRNLYSHTVWRNVKLTARQIIFRQTNYLRVEFFGKKVDLTEFFQENRGTVSQCGNSTNSLSRIFGKNLVKTTFY